MSKYRSIRAGSHASKGEARRAQELHLLQKAGVISDLEEQVTYTLIPKQPAKDGMPLERAVTYTADFRYKENGKTVVEDFKGVRTQQYILRRKLLRWVHGIAIRET